MKFQRGYTLVEVLQVFIIMLVIAGIPGWIWNIVKVVSAISDPITGLFILRVAGIFVPPLGAIVGYF